jgi:hypothetical protein
LPRLLALALIALLLIGSGCVRRLEEEPETDPVIELHFGATPTVSPQGFFVGQSQNLTISVPVTLGSGWSLTELRIYSVRANGDSLTLLGWARDNGDLADSGDAIAGDGVHTGLVSNLHYTEPATLRLRLLGFAHDNHDTFGGVWSATREVSIVPSAEQATLDAIEGVLDHLESEYLSLIDGGADDAAAKAELLAWLELRPDILSATLSPDGDTVWAEGEGGLNFGASLTSYADGPVYGGAPERHPVTPAHRDAGIAPARDGLPEDRWFTQRDPAAVQSNQVLILSPIHDWLLDQGGDPADQVDTLFREAECPGFEVDLRLGADADVASFAELDGHGAVCVVTHGVLGPAGHVLLATGETATLAAVEEWFWELYGSGRSMALLRVADETRLAVGESFLVERNGNFPNSLVQICACQSMTGDLAGDLIAAGAGYVCGFDRAVGVLHASELTRQFWSAVVEGGEPSGAAHDAVSPQSDPGHLGANFTALGNTELIFAEGLSNGDFEQGSLAAWSIQGDARVITQLGETEAVGGYMAIISTGLAEPDADHGQISQQLCLAPGASSLELDFDFFSEEFLEFCDGDYQDWCEISMIPAEGVESVLYFATIDDFCDTVIPADVIFDVGPSGDPDDPLYDPVGVYHTGWRHLSLDIAAFAGETVTLRLRIQADGDSHYHSAMLLEEIAVLEAP